MCECCVNAICHEPTDRPTDRPTVGPMSTDWPTYAAAGSLDRKPEGEAVAAQRRSDAGRSCANRRRAHARCACRSGGSSLLACVLGCMVAAQLGSQNQGAYSRLEKLEFLAVLRFSRRSGSLI